jgi:hypothetical protein
VPLQHPPLSSGYSAVAIQPGLQEYEIKVNRKRQSAPDNIAVIVNISLLHLNSGLTINIFESYARALETIKTTPTPQ